MNAKTESAIAPTLPHSPEHERAILAAILTGHRSASSVLDRLRTDDFFIPQHGRIFEALKSLDEATRPTDELSVYEELSRSGHLEAAGGIAYLGEITKDFQKSIHVEHYATIIRDKALRRSVVHAAAAIQEHALSGADVAAKVIDQAIEKLSAFARDLESDKDCGTTYRDAALGLLQEFDSQEGVRIFTDIDELDRLIGGFRAGELVLFTAETGVGKTPLAQQTRLPNLSRRASYTLLLR
jgi:replicative DNA helicase